jgi:hypothetical protein
VSEKEPYHQRSMFGYILAGLVVAFIAAVFFNPIGNRVDRALNPQPGPSPGTGSPTPSPTPSRGPFKGEESGAHNDQNDSRKELLSQQYDSLSARFTAVEASLQQRARDIGSLTIKPEITASMGTTRSDLAAARDALSKSDFDRAALRLQRIERELKYLESL